MYQEKKHWPPSIKLLKSMSFDGTQSLPLVVKIVFASAPKLVAIIIGCRRREKLVSDTARAMMNQWVTFILFLLTSKISNTKRLATIDTTTEKTQKSHSLADTQHSNTWHFIQNNKNLYSFKNSAGRWCNFVNFVTK